MFHSNLLFFCILVSVTLGHVIFKREEMPVFKEKLTLDEKTKTEKIESEFIAGAAAIFVCNKDWIQKIERFSITTNNTFNCNDEYIHIDIEMFVRKEDTYKTKVTSFFNNDKGCLPLTQKISFFCPRIRR